MTFTQERAMTVHPSVAETVEIIGRLEAVRGVLAPDLSDQELQLFALVAQRSGLDPFAKQIYAIKRKGRVTFQTGIDGLRSTAARTTEYEGSAEPTFEPADWESRPDEGRHPDHATVIVYRFRNGRRIEQSATARWDSYWPGVEQGFQWKKMPDVMLAKCAEAAALRKAFPYVLADLYVAEEMDQAGPPENAAVATAATQPTTAERIAARRQALETTSNATETDDIIESQVTEPEVAQTVERRTEDAEAAGSTPAPGTNPPGLTKRQFVDALAANNIPPEYAMTVRGVLFPDTTVDLTDAKRTELLTELTRDLQPSEAPSEPLSDTVTSA